MITEGKNGSGHLVTINWWYLANGSPAGLRQCQAAEYGRIPVAGDTLRCYVERDKKLYTFLVEKVELFPFSSDMGSEADVFCKIHGAI